MQSLPQIEIEQYKPNLKFFVEMPNEPSNIFGKVCVVLKNGHSSKKNDRWSINVISDYLKTHSWDAAGVEDAVAYLIREEILVAKSNGKLRFDPKRVIVKENPRTVEVM